MTLSRGFYSFIPQKGDSWRWPNFSPAELACHCGWCGGTYFHDPDFLDGLQRVRDRIGRAIRINSGYRCAIHNKEVGGADRSQHQVMAADVSLEGHDRWDLHEAFKAEGFTGFGFGGTFLHVDQRPNPTTWYYGTDSVLAWERPG